MVFGAQKASPDRYLTLFVKETMPEIVSCKIAEEDWICPICGLAPEGSNFRVLLRDQTPRVPMEKWIEDPAKFRWKVTENTGAIKTIENLFGHEVVFYGCMKCLSKKITDDPIARVLFKGMWLATTKVLESRKQTMKLTHRHRIDIYL